VNLVAAKSKNLGMGDVYLDGDLFGSMNQQASSGVFSPYTFAINDLPYGPHEVEIKAQACQNPDGGECGLLVDAFDVIGRH